MQPVSLAATAVSALALAISFASYRLSRRQARSADRHRQRELAAVVVAELVAVTEAADALQYTFRVVNVGPAAALDVDLSFVEWTHASQPGRCLARVDVAAALSRGEARIAVLDLPLEDARFADPAIAIELWADYYDEGGSQARPLALALGDTLVALPPREQDIGARR